MKKLLILALALVFALALVACGTTADDTTLPADDVTEPVGTPDVADGDHVHNYVETVTVAPTCTSLGKKELKCSCGAVDGNFMPIPFAAHDAKDATCTEDSVCATCGKVLVEKYGHLYVDSVVTELTCTTDGVAKSTCHRCGDSTETVLKAAHSFDYSKLTVSKGTVSSKCTKCGATAAFEEEKVLLDLKFDDASELSNLSGFTKSGASPVYANGSARMGGAFLLEYSNDVIQSASKLVLTFDFQMVDEGRTNRGESLFSFLATPAGGSTNYRWIVKYYEADHVFSTVDTGHNADNSVKAERGKWYNFTALIDPAAKEVNCYIDGVSIGTIALPDHSSASGKYQLRIYDAMPNNGTSNPMYDNLKLSVVK